MPLNSKLKQRKQIAIIGGGSAALILAATLNTQRYDVSLYEKKKTTGRKFLVAGEGGLNLTFSAPIDELIQQYHPSAFMEPVIRQCTNDDWRAWLQALGITTFAGSSNRVFPTREWKPAEVLKVLQHAVAENGVKVNHNANWLGWTEEGWLRFDNMPEVRADIVVFALGGASWKVTGSDGGWRDAFLRRGIEVLPFRAANCVFGVNWNEHFIAAHEGKPLKNIALQYDGFTTKGELVITRFGLEGNAIYALSRQLQDGLQEHGSAVIHIDLKPSLTVDRILAKYQSSPLVRVTDILKKTLHLHSTAIALLKQHTDKHTFSHPHLLAAAIKSLPIIIHSSDEMDKAISALGGIALQEVDTHFQLKQLPDTYAIGEMLDWYAPTGGYLLQGCFSMAKALAQHLNTLQP